MLGSACSTLAIIYSTDGDDFGLFIFGCLFGLPSIGFGAWFGNWGMRRLLATIRSAPDLALRRRQVQVTAVLAYLPVALFLYAGQREARVTEVPTDASLIEQFRSHRRDYEEMTGIMLANKSFNWSAAENAAYRTGPITTASPEAVARLRKLLGDTDNLHGVRRFNDGAIAYDYWAVGSAVSDDLSKGIAYLPKPPAKVRATLDKYSPPDQVAETAYRHIEGPWYLFYERIPG